MANAPSVVENEEQMFTLYEVLPPELRTMVVDEMQADDKCKFSQCSKRTNMEVKSSKNFVYSLEFHAFNENELQIEVIPGEYKYYRDMRGFNWLFKNEEGEKSMVCTTIEEEILWTEKLDDSTNLVEYATNYFRDYLKTYQRSVKKLFIDQFFKILGDREKEYDLELQGLNNVRELKLYDTAGLEQIMSKIRRPLRLFEVIGVENSRFLPQFKTLYRTTNILLACQCRLNFSQLKELTARRAEISMGDLTEEEIFDFIESWKNNPSAIKKKLGFYRWELKSSGFSVTKLFQMLRADLDNSSSKTLNIKHNKDFRVEAELHFNNNGSVVDKKYLTLKGL